MPGTDKWCKILPVEYSKDASIGWWDLRKSTAPSGSGEEELTGNGAVTAEDSASHLTFADWSPGIAKWSLGLKMENATVVFDAGTHWD